MVSLSNHERIGSRHKLKIPTNLLRTTYNKVRIVKPTKRPVNMNIDFHCTKCGNCCKNLRLPLSVDESVRWLNSGNPVQVLCEAIPWPAELPDTHLLAAYKRERSFPAMSGQLPIRVLVTLAAPLGESCPNLLVDDNTCGIYEQRPLVCRIYPAEVNPFFKLMPEIRSCPPEAWETGGSPMMRDEVYTDTELRLQIQSKQELLILDVPTQEALCAALGIHLTALANEGFVVYAPDNATLLSALQEVKQGITPATQEWEFISERSETVEMVRSCEATCSQPSDHQPDAFTYLSLFAK
jgi:Fe-S-cluster containining protein